MRWSLSSRADPPARRIADRHYNRQKIGARQFVPPGRCLVLLGHTKRALWVTSWPFAQFVKHAWPGVFVCSAFRNESECLSSDMIIDAAAATLAHFEGPVPTVETWVCDRSTPHVAYVRRTLIAFVTFVDTSKTKKKRDPGRCYLRAGWLPCGMTKAGLLAFGLEVDSLPRPRLAYGEPRLFARGAA